MAAQSGAAVSDQGKGFVEVAWQMFKLAMRGLATFLNWGGALLTMAASLCSHVEVSAADVMMQDANLQLKLLQAEIQSGQKQLKELGSDIQKQQKLLKALQNELKLNATQRPPVVSPNVLQSRIFHRSKDCPKLRAQAHALKPCLVCIDF